MMRERRVPMISMYEVVSARPYLLIIIRILAEFGSYIVHKIGRFLSYLEYDMFTVNLIAPHTSRAGISARSVPRLSQTLPGSLC